MDNNFLKYNIINYTDKGMFYTSGSNLTYMLLTHTGLKPLEEKSAEVVSQNGGHILEVGFGLGLSAEVFISSSIDSYTCIEVNDVVYQHAVTWSLDKQNVTIINGNWEDIIPTLNTQYDGVYYSPLILNYKQFYEICKPICKVGTVISTQGYVFEFSPDSANIVDVNAPSPDDLDVHFDEVSYQSLVGINYYKVYWLSYNGSEYVKSLT
jgi:hypothetical protein